MTAADLAALLEWVGIVVLVMALFVIWVPLVLLVLEFGGDLIRDFFPSVFSVLSVVKACL